MGQLSQKLQSLEENKTVPLSLSSHDRDVLSAINRFNAENRLLLAQTAPMISNSSISSSDKYLHKKFKRLASSHGDDAMSTTSSINTDTDSIMFSGSEVDSRRVPSLVPSPAITETSHHWNGGISNSRMPSEFKSWPSNRDGLTSGPDMLDLMRAHALERLEQNLTGQKVKIKHDDSEDEEVVVVDDNTDEDIRSNAAMELYKKTTSSRSNKEQCELDSQLSNRHQARNSEKSLYQQSILMRQHQQQYMQSHSNRSVSDSPFSHASETQLMNQTITISSSSSTEDIHLLQKKRSPSSVVANSPGRYVCHYCQTTCAKPSVLEKHMRAHTNERPYPCGLCGIAFKTRSNLTKHFR